MTNASVTANQWELEYSHSFGFKLKELASDFLEVFQLSDGFLGKIYFDGRFFYISSYFSWKEIMIDHNYYKYF